MEMRGKVIDSVPCFPTKVRTQRHNVWYYLSLFRFQDTNNDDVCGRLESRRESRSANCMVYAAFGDQL
jgi:hypothetical protein